MNTVATDILPKEIDTLQLADKLFSQINDVLDMDNKTIKNIVTYIIQNQGQLSSRKARRLELKEWEIEAIEDICEQMF